MSTYTLPPRPAMPLGTTSSPSPSFHPRPSSPHVPPLHHRSSSTSRIESSTSGFGGGKNPTNASSRKSTTPRLGPGIGLGVLGLGSGLRNELGDEGDKGKGKVVSDDLKEKMKEAQAILQLLSNLPAPLPESLPPTFLPTPSPSPPNTKPPTTFTDFVNSQTQTNKKKRKSSSLPSNSASGSGSGSASGSGEEGSSPSPPAIANIGLGFGLGLETNARKKPRHSTPSPPNSAELKINGPAPSPELGRSFSSQMGLSNGRAYTPEGRGSASPNSTAMGLPGLPGSSSMKKDVGRSRLRNEIGRETEAGDGKEGWSREKWREMGQVYRTRALLLKRHGDAHSGAHNAPPSLLASLPYNLLQALLCHTDAVLLWLYAYFCEEQAGGRVRSSPYAESEKLRRYVREKWESEMRKSDDEKVKEMARGMVGLMYLIDAVVCYHLTAEQLAHLNRRGKELSATPSYHGPSPSSSTSVSPPAITQPSPAAHSTSSSTSHTHNPTISGTSPPSGNHGQYSFPNDLLPLITASTSTSQRAAHHLLTSRHHLPLSLLKQFFPKTYLFAINSELSDEALPAPGDSLGAARRVDVDEPSRFVWPIELGMCSPIAHVTAFGRCLVKEFAESLGIQWDLTLGSV